MQVCNLRVYDDISMWFFTCKNKYKYYALPKLSFIIVIEWDCIILNTCS